MSLNKNIGSLQTGSIDFKEVDDIISYQTCITIDNIYLLR